MNSPYAIGIDIGGTNLKAVAVDASGGVLDRVQRATADGEVLEGVPAAATAARKIVNGWVADRGEPVGIGISAPGVAHPDGRCIHFMAGRMEGLVGFHWAEFLDRPTVVSNDAHAALAGEAWIGAAGGLSHAALFTLGTGVGGALLLDGEIFRGHTGRAGHLGHMSLDPWGEPGIFKTPGVLEDFIGQSTVARRSAGKYASVEELASAAADGDPVASESWKRSIRALAAGIANVANVFDPEAIVLSGGITGSWDLLLRGLEEELHLVEWRPHGHRVKLLKATLGAWSGAVGNARIAFLEAKPTTEEDQ